MGTGIVVTSGKGGTGKTSVTGGVGCCLAALGYQVLCIDMDIGLRNLDLSLGMADQTSTSLPLTDSIRASAIPQVPAPKTPIFRAIARNLRILTPAVRGEFLLLLYPKTAGPVKTPAGRRPTSTPPGR